MRPKRGDQTDPRMRGVRCGRQPFRQKRQDDRGDHLILLAKNLEGYHNLARIVSYAFIEGFYYRPRVDKELLRLYHDGIICCSACLGGELPQAIMHGNIDEAHRVVEEFKSIFGEDYYLELCNCIRGNARIDAQVREPEKGQRSDPAAGGRTRRQVHRVERRAFHHGRRCAGARPADLPEHGPRPGRSESDAVHVQEVSEERRGDGRAVPGSSQALATTAEIAAKVESYSLEHKPLMPNFPIPDDFEIPLDKLKETFLKKAGRRGAARGSERLRVARRRDRASSGTVRTVDDLETVPLPGIPDLPGCRKNVTARFRRRCANGSNTNCRRSSGWGSLVAS